MGQQSEQENFLAWQGRTLVRSFLNVGVPSFENQEMNGNDNNMANFRYTYLHFGPILSIYMWGVVMGSKEGPFVELSAFKSLFSINVRYQKKGINRLFLEDNIFNNIQKNVAYFAIRY
jgi:hypothetical protein